MTDLTVHERVHDVLGDDGFHAFEFLGDLREVEVTQVRACGGDGLRELGSGGEACCGLRFDTEHDCHLGCDVLATLRAIFGVNS